jgi:hypothetical protein
MTTKPLALVPVELVDKIRADLDAALDIPLAEKLQYYEFCASHAAVAKVTDAASLAEADEMAKELLREWDALEAVRKSGATPLDRLAKHINAKIKRLRDVLEAAIANLKKERGEYLVAQKRLQDESFQAAAAAHMAGEHASAQIALEVAVATTTAAPQGTSVREVWVVKRILPDLMVLSTPEVPGLIPDESSIAAYARKFPAGERPVVAGVVFELVPQVTDRR